MSKLIKTNLPCWSCTSSDAAAEYEDGMFCFSCKKQKSYKNRVKFAKPPESIVALPKDFTDNLSEKAIAYLYKYGICDSQIKKAGIGWSDNCYIYSPHKEKWVNLGPRLIFPYYENGSLLFFEARSLEKNPQLKWVTVGGKKDLYYTRKKKVKSLVVVEDIISALKISPVAPSVALRGTGCNLEKLLHLKALSYRFIIWLDGDKPGRQAADKLMARLKWYAPTYIVRTTKDPKCYSKKEIQQILSDQLSCQIKCFGLE